MTNELGTALQEILKQIEAKDKRKQEALEIVNNRMKDAIRINQFHIDIPQEELETIRKYIEEN